MTPRDEARRHWLDLADPDSPPSPEAIAWLRGVALRMIEADLLPPHDRREAVFDASGLRGAAEDGTLQVILIALREYERTRVTEPRALRGTTPAEFVAARLEWDKGETVAPDALRKRIHRAIDELGDAEMSAWSRAVLKRK
ncbi:hypothetical protein [Ideonella sp. A 288]|uniref:hypothetical protein n=1 Tax=Ideonella sp. A 288 TaxID=1962181 RepID=UPI001186C30F|nr:hypothetical protein [Ideonella sp. A 288]